MFILRHLLTHQNQIDMKNTLKLLTFALMGVTFMAVSCQKAQKGIKKGYKKEQADDAKASNNSNRNIKKAVAVIHSNSTDVTGWVTFTKVAKGIKVHGELSGLKDGKHGFHIHTYGDCRADDYSSAGGHFNPAGNDHAAPTDSLRHMGDMGNIKSSNGTATIDYTDSVITLNQVIGRAVIIHQGTDDLTSQPSGAAGSRIGCGVIGIANSDFSAK